MYRNLLSKQFSASVHYSYEILRNVIRLIFALRGNRQLSCKYKDINVEPAFHKETKT